MIIDINKDYLNLLKKLLKEPSKNLTFLADMLAKGRDGAEPFSAKGPGGGGGEPFPLKKFKVFRGFKFFI